ncbi:MAG: hypothetical protein ACFHWZ_16915 [Phycisphaerales bacterium]
MKDNLETPGPARSRADGPNRPPQDVCGELARLFNDIEREAIKHREELIRILDASAGVTFDHVDELKDFKRSLRTICDRLGVQPRTPDGSPASLQINGVERGKGYVFLLHKQKMTTCGAGANTIPQLRVE